jgi:hypothetical protein
MEALATQLSQQLPYEVRALSHEDDAQIYALQKQYQRYFDLFMDHKLTQREATSDLDELAAEAAVAQKQYLGFFDKGQLMGTVDLTIDYPLPQLVWLGQYFTDQSISVMQRREMLENILQTLKQLTAVQVQLFVLKADKDGQQFYQQLAFEPISETRTTIAGDWVDVTIYQRNL